MYAVTIEPMPSIYFVSERPEGKPWEAIENSTKIEIQEGVGIEIPTNILMGAEGADIREQVLCRSRNDPKQYKLYKNRGDIDRSEFVPTGKNFGGAYSRRAWDRFVELLPAHLKFLAIPDTDPPGAMEEALRNIRGAG